MTTSLVTNLYVSMTTSLVTNLCVSMTTSLATKCFPFDYCGHSVQEVSEIDALEARCLGNTHCLVAASTLKLLASLSGRKIIIP